MLTRYDHEALSMFEHVADRGYAEIDKSRVYRWYGADRLGKQSWRDLAAKWEETAGQDQLLVAHTAGSFVFIQGKGLITSADSWYKSINN